MREVTATVAELEIGDNILKDGYHYMVVRIDPHPGDLYATVKLGYARKVVAGSKRINEFSAPVMQKITKLIK